VVSTAPTDGPRIAFDAPEGQNGMRLAAIRVRLNECDHFGAGCALLVRDVHFVGLCAVGFSFSSGAVCGLNRNSS